MKVGGVRQAVGLVNGALATVVGVHERNHTVHRIDIRLGEENVHERNHTVHRIDIRLGEENPIVCMPYTDQNIRITTMVGAYIRPPSLFNSRIATPSISAKVQPCLMVPSS